MAVRGSVRRLLKEAEVDRVRVQNMGHRPEVSAIDGPSHSSDNQIMSIDTIPIAESDMQAVTDAVLAGRPIPPDVLKRVDERAAAVRERIKRDHGILDISVPLIRQAREAGH